jgi:hypothetical protein
MRSKMLLAKHRKMPLEAGRVTCPRASSGFTFIEVLLFFLMLLCVVIGVVIAHERWGGRFGWLWGGIAGLVLFLVLGLVWALIVDFGVKGIPRLPRCRDGCCRGEDYKLQQFGEEFYWVCQHGVRYKRRGRRFVVVNDNGIETPYLIWRPFRGWFSDGWTSG